jgi:hypothetical protein
MRNKLIAVVAASVLPLGFAAAASATDPTGSHEVTFTVADARSISVEVLLGDTGVLDLGVVGTDELSANVADAVAVTFRATDAVDTTKVDINVQLRQNNEGLLGDAVSPVGLNLIANANDIVIDGFTLGAANSGSNEKGSPYVESSADYLYRGLNKTGGFGDTTFNVGFQLDTKTPDTQTGDFSFFILYSLTDHNPS